MEPLGLVAVSFQAIDSATRISRRLAKILTGQEVVTGFDGHLRRYRNALALLEHLPANLSGDIKPDIPTLYSHLELTSLNLSRLGELISLMMGSTLQRVLSVNLRQVAVMIDIFVADVFLTRDLTYGAALAHLVSQSNQFQEASVGLMRQGKVLSNLTDNVEAILNTVKRSQAGQQWSDHQETDLEHAQDNLHETKEALRAILQTQQQPRSTKSDGFSFPFNIVQLTSALEAGVAATARIQLDTGCEENWIRTAIVDRAGLQDNVISVHEPRAYIGFGGASVTPAGRINITWFSENRSLTRESWFLVHADVPFDAVLGRQSVIGDGGIAFSNPLLALRHLELDKGSRYPPVDHGDRWVPDLWPGGQACDS